MKPIIISSSNQNHTQYTIDEQEDEEGGNPEEAQPQLIPRLICPSARGHKLDQVLIALLIWLFSSSSAASSSSSSHQFIQTRSVVLCVLFFVFRAFTTQQTLNWDAAPWEMRSVCIAFLCMLLLIESINAGSSSPAQPSNQSHPLSRESINVGAQKSVVYSSFVPG